MTAIESLEALGGDCWPCDLRAHLMGGIVVATPRFAVLLRPVWREWDREKLTNPWEVAPDGDCWFLWGLAGNPTACFRAAWAVAEAAGGEAVADRQLARFKADPANKGRTCRVGLWSVSRHPNYFFEWLHWVAWAVIELKPKANPPPSSSMVGRMVIA